MKFTTYIIALTLLTSSSLMAFDEECLPNAPRIMVGGNLVSDLANITDKMYVKVMNLKVNLDGEGSLSIYYDEEGKPQLMRLKYKSKNGAETSKVLTFKDIAEGKALEYENKDVPGKAIVVGRAEPFQRGDAYQFKVSLRSKVNPDKYDSHVIEFGGTKDSPVMKNNNSRFGTMILSPGVSWMSWDGTFKKVEFKP